MNEVPLSRGKAIHSKILRKTIIQNTFLSIKGEARKTSKRSLNKNPRKAVQIALK